MQITINTKGQISVVESVKSLLTDELITKIVDDALMKLNEENNNQNRLLELHKELKETNNKINQFTELLIQSRNIDLIMDKMMNYEIKLHQYKKPFLMKKNKT